MKIINEIKAKIYIRKVYKYYKQGDINKANHYACLWKLEVEKILWPERIELPELLKR